MSLKANERAWRAKMQHQHAGNIIQSHHERNVTESRLISNNFITASGMQRDWQSQPLICGGSREAVKQNIFWKYCDKHLSIGKKLDEVAGINGAVWWIESWAKWLTWIIRSTYQKPNDKSLILKCEKSRRNIWKNRRLCELAALALQRCLCIAAYMRAISSAWLLYVVKNYIINLPVIIINEEENAPESYINLRLLYVATEKQRITRQSDITYFASGVKRLFKIC